MLTIHGRWKICVDNQVVMQWFADSWNEEAAITYIKEFREKVKPLINSQWAIISILENWELGVPEIEQHIVEHCDWFKAHGCVKDCHVYSPNILKEMQLEKMISCSENNYERKVFSQTEDAVKWLASVGFKINNSSFLNQNR